MVEYGNFLEVSFDGTHNATPSLAQIYIISKPNNESYTLKKMLQHPDRDKFINIMKKEVLAGVIMKRCVEARHAKNIRIIDQSYVCRIT